MLRDSGSFALGDEPLSCGVEHKPWTREIKLFSNSGKPLGQVVDLKIRKQWTRTGKRVDQVVSREMV